MSTKPAATQDWNLLTKIALTDPDDRDRQIAELTVRLRSLEVANAQLAGSLRNQDPTILWRQRLSSRHLDMSLVRSAQRGLVSSGN